MIKIENVEVSGWEAAIRGMRNPMNSWSRSDSDFDTSEYDIEVKDDYIRHTKNSNFRIGDNDLTRMKQLAKDGPVHAKYRRMVVVSLDITAPLYWWKEYDTYKVGTVANSCSTMHKIAEKEFTLEDFSCEHLNLLVKDTMKLIIKNLNSYRELYLQTKDKVWWWQMIQLLPSSYNQRRTVMLNYEVLAGLYPMRKQHKLDEWREFCDWIETLPYSEIITGKEENDAAE